jgi:excisionase family DNA binding protein
MTQAIPLLTTGEAALRLHVTDETVRRWIAAGKIPAITLPSGQFRIKEADIDAILAGDQ